VLILHIRGYLGFGLRRALEPLGFDFTGT